MDETRTVLVTGGAGFVGSSLVAALVASGRDVVVADALNHPAASHNLTWLTGLERCRVIRVDLRDAQRVDELVSAVRPEWVFHLAAETHVDTSFNDPDRFKTVNVTGTENLINALRKAQNLYSEMQIADFRFIYISSILSDPREISNGLRGEETHQKFDSPYAMSKSVAEGVVMANINSGFANVIISKSSNNYGPRQLPEKLIPMAIVRSIKNLDLPVYGDGSQKRDWLHVADHVSALIRMAEAGELGATYRIGGKVLYSNLNVIEKICEQIDALQPAPSPRRRLMHRVQGRPADLSRRVLDTSKAECDLGWAAAVDFETGLRDTVRWYFDNRRWWADRFVS
jgi:dTDP-glucose 4,6-dehydratase